MKQEADLRRKFRFWINSNYHPCRCRRKEAHVLSLLGVTFTLCHGAGDRRFEGRILGVSADVPLVAGGTTELQGGAALIVALG